MSRKTKKRVLIVTNSILGGGAEKSMLTIAKELSAKQWCLQLIAINNFKTIDSDFPIVQLNRENNLGSTLRTFYEFQKLVKSFKPDICILNCDLSELFGVFIPEKKMKIVVVEHSQIPWNNRKLLGLLIRKLLNFRNAAFVSVSETIISKRPGQEYLETLENPLETISAAEEFRTTKSTINRLVFVGRLSQEKNPMMLLEILRQISLHCLFIGEGKMEKNLREYSNLYNLSSEFAGFQTAPWQLLQDGDLLVVPSLTEGDCLVLLEAIGRNIPVIVSDIPIFRRLNLPEIVYCENTEAFIDAINMNIKNIEAFNAKNDFMENYLKTREIESIIHKWEAFLFNISD